MLPRPRYGAAVVHLPKPRSWASFAYSSVVLVLLLLLAPTPTITVTAAPTERRRLRRPDSDNSPSLQQQEQQRQAQVEATFVAALSAESARASLQYLTSEPHMAGTPGDLKMAQYVQAQWQSFGIQEAEIQPVSALLSYPLQDKQPSLFLLDHISNTPLFTAALTEPILPEDPTSDTWLRNHTYLGYSPSGNVTAPLVYANYGRPEDFDVLEAAGVVVKGTIVLVRYGACFRGLKVMNAEQRGALGVLIYSDPQQDGFTAGPVYPAGPWRPPFGVQRGSVQFLSLCAGDPGRAALMEEGLKAEDVCGYATDDMKPKIPVLPISYGDATPFLQSLADAAAAGDGGSPIAPPSFQGGLNLTYHMGPSMDLVGFATHNQELVGDIWNVIGLVKSRYYGTRRDRLVVLGNHRDAWVDGAVDPNSGTAAQLELAKGLGALLQTGWKPRRTIVLASWSGEELGLIGSTAWGEKHAKELNAKAVLYVNVDSAVSGPFFQAGATPSLKTLLQKLQEDVRHPYDGQPVARNWTAEGGIGILGSGSDYTVFLDHLGISSIDMGALIDRHRRPYGMYHSVYDSFAWMSRFGDPDFTLHVMMSEIWGKLALRVADSLLLPLDHDVQAKALRGYVEELEKRVGGREGGRKGGREGGGRNSLDLTLLKRAVWAYGIAAKKVSAEVEVSWKGEGGREEGMLTSLASLNDRLAFTERRFCAKKGLPRRMWFKHVLQAPGLYLGYEGESLPGVTQAVSDGEWGLAQEQVWVAAGRIAAAARFLGEGKEEEEGKKGEKGVVAVE